MTEENYFSKDLSLKKTSITLEEKTRQGFRTYLEGLIFFFETILSTKDSLNPTIFNTHYKLLVEKSENYNNRTVRSLNEWLKIFKETNSAEIQSQIKNVEEYHLWLKKRLIRIPVAPADIDNYPKNRLITIILYFFLSCLYKRVKYRNEGVYLKGRRVFP